MAIMNFDTAHLLDQLRSVNRTSLSDEDARLQVLSAARALCRRLETPYEWVLRMTWEEVSRHRSYAFSNVPHSKCLPSRIFSCRVDLKTMSKVHRKAKLTDGFGILANI